MKGSPERKAFWRLFSPLVAYWIVQIVFSFLLSFVMMIMKAKELAPILFTDQESMTEVEIQTVMDTVNQIAGEFYVQYQLECATASALCLILVMGVMFWQDRKREAAGRLAVSGSMAPMGRMPQMGQMPSMGQTSSEGRGASMGQAAPAGQGASMGRVAGNGRMEPAVVASGSKYVLLFGLGVSFCLAANCLVGMTELAFADEAYQEAAAVLYGPSFPMQVLCSGLIIPLSEELFYRGLVFKRFRERVGFLGAAFISSFIFSTSHGNVVQALYTIGLGMLLSYAYEKYGSFKAPLFLHVVANVTSLVCTRTGVFDWLMKNKPWMAALAVAGTFVGTTMYVMIQKIGEEKADKPAKE